MPDQFDALAARFGGTAVTEAPAAPVGPKGVSVSPGAAMSMHVPDLSALAPSNWPMIGGAVGGIIGSPAGGVPGAAGGALLGGAAGEAFKQLANRAMGRPAPGTMTDAASGIAKEGAIQGGMELAGGALTKGAGAAGTALYRGYLKPALNAVDLPKAREIVATALREALPISKGGEAKGQAIISQINRQVESILNNVGDKVDLHQIADRVRAFAKNRFNKPGVDTADLDAANRVADLIDQHPSLGLPAGTKPTRVDVSATQANEVKQAVRPNSRAYGEERSAAIETRKAAGHELRANLEQVAPDIGPMNARERQVIDALEAIQRANGREENRNLLFGVPTLLSGVGGLVGSQVSDPVTAAFTALAARALLTPQAASRAAILANRLARVPGVVPANAMRTAAMVALSEEQGQKTP